MNPWKIIGWIVLGGMVLMLTLCGLVVVGVSSSGDGPRSTSSSGSSPPAATAPAYAARVDSFECEERAGRTRADMTITNTGAIAIPYAKAFVEFSKGGQVTSADDTYFSPSTIPPGARASATFYSGRGSDADTCSPKAVQDGDGYPVLIQ